ncbi:MAG: AAA family ATPase, partial [Deltaproteobacteria bacterium]|nr:AAA family ATPase [Deltaproteobacteria bacterium]
QALVEALKKPSAYPHPTAEVVHLQTHISSVFLTGQYAYKLKKPVDFGFLDFTTLAKREHFCREELRLNKRLAPDIYLKVEKLTQTPDGIKVGGPGPALDWVVVMRQLDQSRMGLEVLNQGGLNKGLIEDLVDLLTPFYQQAATGQGIDELGQIEAIRFNTDENFAQTRGYIDVCLSAGRFQEIEDFTNRFLADQADLLNRRIDEGRIRECHGDLHLANICFQEPPVIYDCIEFNQRFRCSDVAADLAFLAMDLDFHGLPDLAGHLIQTYAARSGDQELPLLIDFYKCYRAYVRGKIHAFTWDDPAVRGRAKEENLSLAKRYFSLAQTYAGGRNRPLLVVLHGLMGTGKSALGRWLWGRYGWVNLRSDLIRKKLAGLEETAKVADPYGQGLYSPQMSARTYAELLDRAQDLLQAGCSVVLDGSYQRRADREAAAAAAEQAGARIFFIKTTCQPDEQRRRLERRWLKKETSDGRAELMDRQAQAFEPPGPVEDGRLAVIQTDGPKTRTRALAEAALKANGLID